MKKLLFFISIIFILFISINVNASTITSLSFSQNSSVHGFGGHDGLSFRSFLMISPSDATYDVQWSSSNSSVGTVNNNGFLTFNSRGTTTLTAYSPSCKCSASMSVTLTEWGIRSVTIKGVNLSPEFSRYTTSYTATVPYSTNSITISAIPVTGTVSGTGTFNLAVGTNTFKLTSKSPENWTTTYTFKIKREDGINVSGLDISPTSKEIYEGQNFKINYTVTPYDASNKNVTFKSSDEKIATVDSIGNVQGIRPGYATITATATDGGFIKACSIIVKSKTINTEKIVLGDLSRTLYENQSFKLTHAVYPENATNKNVIFKSSDPNIAIVDQFGTVTAISKGEAIITVIGANNISSKCYVTVEKKITNITNINITPQTLILTPNEVAKINYSYSPTEIDNYNIILSSSDTSIATIEKNGEVTAINTGICYITIEDTISGTSNKIPLVVVDEISENDTNSNKKAKNIIYTIIITVSTIGIIILEYILKKR